MPLHLTAAAAGVHTRVRLFQSTHNILRIREAADVLDAVVRSIIIIILIMIFARQCCVKYD